MHLYKKYFLITLFVFTLITLPVAFATGVRTYVAALFSPFWKLTAKLKTPAKEGVFKSQLEVENERLRFEVARLKKMTQVTDYQCDTVAASVIYRDPVNWMSALWIDVGEECNRRRKKKIIEKNSPVVVGRALVGVVDYVGEKQSKVRLLTDLGCKPSVCVERNAEECYLARGVLQGTNAQFWKKKSQLLGIGFPSGAMIQENDLLVTTGLDGVFPKGLRCATVTKVHPLKVGDYSYDIEATPAVSHLDTIDTVFVLSSLGFVEEKR